MEVEVILLMCTHSAECTSLCHSDNAGTVPDNLNPTGPTLGQYFKWCEMRQSCATVVAGIVVGAVVGALSLIILVSVAIILLGKYT